MPQIEPLLRAGYTKSFLWQIFRHAPERKGCVNSNHSFTTGKDSPQDRNAIYTDWT
jgi:hypothetical protein